LEVKSLNPLFKKIINNKKIVFIFAIFGISLIILPNIFVKNEKKNELSIESSQNFVKNVQNDLEKMISEIEGAGKTMVLVTLETSEELVYAIEKKQKNETIKDASIDGTSTLKKEIDDSEKRYITTKDSNGNEKPLILRKIEPKIRGAVISCKGAKNKNVRENVIKTVTTALNISSDKVYVTQIC